MTNINTNQLTTKTSNQLSDLWCSALLTIPKDKSLDVLIINSDNLEVPKIISRSFENVNINVLRKDSDPIVKINIRNTTFNKYSSLLENFIFYDVIILECSFVSDNKYFTKEYLDLFFKLLKNNTSQIFFSLPDNLDSKLMDYFLYSFRGNLQIAYNEEINSFFRIKEIKRPLNYSKHTHLYLKCTSSDTSIYTDCNKFAELLKDTIKDYFTIKTEVLYPFEYGGHSGCFILGESHCNWHTYPEDNFLSIDIYSCKGISMQITEDLKTKYNFKILDEQIQFR